MYKKEKEMIKVIIEQDGVVLDTMELTELQEKALVLEADDISEFLIHKMTRILGFTLGQAIRKFSEHEISKKTIQQLITIADEIKAKKTIEQEET